MKEKINKLTLLPLAVAMLVMSPAALAQNPELDMTMTIMEEGQEPAGFVQKLQLPTPAEIGVREDVVVEKSLNGIADEVREKSGELTEEAAGTVTDGVKDVLSIDGAEDLPEDIVDNLSDDLPLLDGDGLPDLPDLPDLPGGSARDNLPQDAVPEAGGVDNDAVDEAVKGAGDAGSEVGKTLEETRNLLP